MSNLKEIILGEIASAEEAGIDVKMGYVVDIYKESNHRYCLDNVRDYILFGEVQKDE